MVKQSLLSPRRPLLSRNGSALAWRIPLATRSSRWTGGRRGTSPRRRRLGHSWPGGDRLARVSSPVLHRCRPFGRIPAILTWQVDSVDGERVETATDLGKSEKFQNRVLTCLETPLIFAIC